MKKLIIAFILWLFLINRSYGQWWFKIKDGDCSQASINYFNRIRRITENNKIVTKDVYNKAIENLKKYCNLERNVPQTPLFLNQLLDVAFRKIDAIKWLTYWLVPDPLWEQWRKYLNIISEKNDEDPKNIIAKFKKFWWSPGQNIEANNKTLYWKYLLACDEIGNICNYLNVNDNNTIIHSIFMNTCKQMVRKRYLEELTLIQKLTFINFYTNIDKKLFKSFLKHTNWGESFSDKLMRLYDKFTVALWNFQYLVLRFVKVLDANTN